MSNPFANHSNQTLTFWLLLIFMFLVCDLILILYNYISVNLTIPLGYNPINKGLYPIK